MLVSSTGKPQAQHLTAVSCPVLSYPAVQSSTRVSVYLSQELDARLLRPLHVHTIPRLLCHSADRAWRYCPRLGVRSREPHRLVCGHAFRGRYPVGAPAHHQPIPDAGSERLLVDECRAEDYSGGHRTRGDACQVRLCWCALVRAWSALNLSLSQLSRKPIGVPCITCAVSQADRQLLPSRGCSGPKQRSGRRWPELHRLVLRCGLHAKFPSHFLASKPR